MNVRPVDTTKKSNIKCEHCKYWKLDSICDLSDTTKRYYNRCKYFEWKEEYIEAQEEFSVCIEIGGGNSGK
jgi:hypothetical protein